MRHPGLALGCLIAAALLTPRASAGIFVYAIRSTQIELDPPRYRSVIGFYDRYAVPLYGVRADSTMHAGVNPRARILEASGPPWMHVSVDPAAGTALWVADSVVTYFPPDSLIVVTGSPNPCFEMVYLTGPTGYDYKYIEQCFMTDQVTVAHVSTWGRVKSAYR